MRLILWSFRYPFFFSGRSAWKSIFITFFGSVRNKHNILSFWVNMQWFYPVLNVYKMACEFLSSQKLLQLLHQQTPYQLVLMLIYNAILKLAELVPHLFLFSSRNSVALDIYLGKRRTIEPLLMMLFIANFKKGSPGTKRQSSRSFRKCTCLFSACVISFTQKVQQIRDTYFFLSRQWTGIKY